MGVDELGVDEMGVDKMGSRQIGSTLSTLPKYLLFTFLVSGINKFNESF